jgi:hypothetical protein
MIRVPGTKNENHAAKAAAIASLISPMKEDPGIHPALPE